MIPCVFPYTLYNNDAMNTNPFATRAPSVATNARIRTPQREAYAALVQIASTSPSTSRELGIVLPVGCGKSGCIALTPFAFKARRTLVVAPNVAIAEQLRDEFDPSHADMFYTKCAVLSGPPYPEPVEIRGTTTNVGDLEEAHVVITNIQQLQGTANRWIEQLPADLFDLILFDEGHHNTAASWSTLKGKFPTAMVVNYSATPLRADGQLMAGDIIYSYPVFRAIQEGYVKHLKAVVLNPRTLRYVRHEDDVEIEVSLEEVRQLGEEDADFRRSIVTSEETLTTIVDASIRELTKLRRSADDPRLKIIASALNFAHCQQIVEAYRARGMRADYVHSREDGAANRRVLKKLDSHELDVIVQVRKLGEGFDHKHLAVAAVFSIFSNLSPFVQFVGRIMRVIEQNAPGHPKNQGVVVFHAGANVARRWQDFQEYSEADREYFDHLLPVEGLDFTTADELELDPSSDVPVSGDKIDVRGQGGVEVEEIPLLQDDPKAMAALKVLHDKGYTADELHRAYEELTPVPVTKARQRQAKRLSVDARVRTAVGRVLKERRLNPEGHELDSNRLGRTNFVVLKAAIDSRVNAEVGRKYGERHEFTRPELDTIESRFTEILEDVIKQVFHGAD
jgi:superfamily II DNA or RNA helicase